jgi:hypothetical protein
LVCAYHQLHVVVNRGDDEGLILKSGNSSVLEGFEDASRFQDETI